MKVGILSVLLVLLPFSVSAQEWFSETVFRAEVVDVVSSSERVIPMTGVVTVYQTLTVRFVEGPREGALVEVGNESSVILSPGDIFYLHVTPVEDGELYSVGEPDRTGVLLSLVALFVLVTALAGGAAGIRALVSLAGSFALIVFALVPLLSSGAPPVLTSVILALFMLVFSMLVTHGWNRPTLIALSSSFVALLLTACVAESAVAFANLSGFVSDETVFLNFATEGKLNLSGLVLGGILIGVVGVLNDISVSQAHTVAELHGANSVLSKGEVFRKAMKVGREHLGAVVNTLPLAYAGTALPLLMLFSTSDAPFMFIANREVFAVEIIRILSGGIALSLSGAIATALAVWFIVRHKRAG